MRDLIELLARLYPDISSSKKILRYADIPHVSIPFEAAADNNWVAIYDSLEPDPLKLIKLFEQIMIDAGEGNRPLLEAHATALKKKLAALPGKVILSNGKINPVIFIRNVVFAKLAFINRQNIITQFQRMLDFNNSENMLIIEGPSGSGLTHIHLYLADVINEIKKYKLIQHLHESQEVIENDRATNAAGKSNGGEDIRNAFSGSDLALVISSRLGLGYDPEEESKKAISKYTTFFTKLNEFNEDKPKSEIKIPVICLDGLYKDSNPNLNRFIGKLLHEAITYKKYHVILTLNKDSFMQNEWPPHLKKPNPGKDKVFNERGCQNICKEDIYTIL